MQRKRIRLMIVDHRKIIPKEVAALLTQKSDFELIAKASNSAETICLCDKMHPDVVLINLEMQGVDVTGLMQTIGETHPDIQLVAESDFSNQELVRVALQVGAMDHMLNTLRVDKAAEAIRSDPVYELAVCPKGDGYWSAPRSSLKPPHMPQAEKQAVSASPIKKSPR
jgi:two-component system, NarL family, response regulator LiaR